ncbi:NADP-dependent oxidoreductase [Streptosporangium sp. NBC_01469]|uniref:NADP-dependent oxidoreductase n=1 Tax=Streptosporangium sp. NBC_01469 TaxID=2903898 RepID=UPI002E2A8987|nr:NADP-dependent oxidoreductase [Streptosporangium sp. NBC_01469]
MSQAIRYARYGGPEVLTLDDVPIPDPGPGQVRVAVRAAGVNGIDWKLRYGFMDRGQLSAGPAGVGVEFAGTVDAVGAGAGIGSGTGVGASAGTTAGTSGGTTAGTGGGSAAGTGAGDGGWSVGQAVFGKVVSGAAATHVTVDARDLLAMPAWLSFEQAAALPVAVETAWRTLRQLDVKEGHTLLVHAVAGGVGLVAAQLARARGVRVVGTASPARHDFLRELGVRPVEYGDGGDGLAGRVRAAAPEGVDAVLDASGRDVLAMSVELAGGPDRVVTIADGRAAEYGVRFSTGADGVSPAEVFAEVLPLLERGALRVPIERTFPLGRTADAHRLSEEGHRLGKIVVTVP